MAKASFTVEAVFVVSICIWVLVALCYGGLYVHDRAVMVSDVNSIVNRELIQRMSEDEGKSRKEINEHLYLLKIRQITKKKYLAWSDYSYSVSSDRFCCGRTCSRQLSYRYRQISWHKEQCDGNRQYR